MKKINSKLYAQALYDAVKETSNQDFIIKNFTKLLFEHNQLSRVNEIISEFKKIYNKNENMIDAEVTSSHRLAEDEKTQIINLIKELKNADKVVLNEIMDKRNLGGVRISFDDIIIDGTINNKLNIIKKAVMSNE